MLEIPSRFSGPGLVDLQLNGYAGFDFNAPARAWTLNEVHRVSRRLGARGVVAALPTIITDDAERMLSRAERYAELVDEEPALARRFPGLHIEGPFIASEDGPRGAHPEAYCRTPAELPDFLDELLAASGGRIAVLTLAPELEGAIGLIERAARQRICVAIGHTQASPEEIEAAERAGARFSTHLGNGSHQLLPRHANYIQAQLARDGLSASFIADGHHVPFYVLKNFIRAKMSARSILVTDAMAAAEVGAGTYRLGEDEVVVRKDLYVSKPGEPNLAGSALTLDRAVLNVARHCDVAFEVAWQMASTQPAALIGLDDLPEVTVEVSEDGFQAIEPRQEALS